jgi:hypothetical protein
MVDLGVRYLELVLRLRRLEPELVSDYFGPEELAIRVDAEAPMTATQLLGQATGLLEQIHGAGLEPMRRRWLSAHVGAIHSVCGWLEGEQLGYRELGQRCYGIRPVPVPEESFERAHRMLDDALPGAGDLRARYQRWMASQTVPTGLLTEGLDALAGELSARARETFDLPPDELAIFELVSDQPWLGFAGPLGDGRTLIRLNQDHPIASFRLLEIVTHEGYPGHHCEAACKGAALIAAKGWSEQSSWGYCLPQAMISEGIAELALEALLGSEADEVGAAVLRPLAIPYDAAVASVARKAWEMLRPVRPNLAMMLDEHEIPRQEAWEYLRTWRLEEDEYIDRTLASLLERRWKPYESCYTDGLTLCRQFVHGDPARFQRLLAEPLIPRDLVDETPEAT